MRKFLKFILGICVVATFVALGVYGTQALVVSDENAAGGQGREPKPTRVGVAQVKAQTIVDEVSAVGTLRPVRTIEIVPEVAGRVTEVAVTSGETVAEGDLLIGLDDRAARASLAEAQASLEVAEQEYRRIQRLEDSNAAAEARLQEARAAFRRAEARVMMAQTALDNRTITAPFGGVLGVLDVAPGALLTGDAAVTRLADLSRVQVAMSLPERYFDRVRPGQTMQVTTPAYPDTSFEGVVTVRAPEIDLGTRSFEIRAEIDNADGRLVGGMFANARLALNSYDGLAVPDDAIISEGMDTYVYTVVDGTARRTGVTVGASLDPLTEISSGLGPQDRVVVAGWDQLSDGAPVTVDDSFSQEGLR